MTHPVLHSEERRAALASLPDGGLVSLRQLSDCWGWTVASVRRFLTALEKAGLISVEKSKYGTRITRHTPPAHIGTHRHTPAHVCLLKVVAGSADTDSDPAHVPAALGSTGLLQQPRAETGSVENREPAEVTAGPTEAEVAAYAKALIERLNASLRANTRIDDFKPIGKEQRGSMPFVREWIALGVDLDWALSYVWTQGQIYVPKPGRPPQIKSLAYFRWGLPRDWKQRSQQQLGLMSIENGGAPAVKPAMQVVQAEHSADDSPPISDEQLRAILEG